MDRRTYYVAGPMRDYDCFNFPMFDQCAADLRQWDLAVISPAEHDREIGFDETKNSLEGFNLAESLMWDLEQIALHSDGIVLLPGWERSTGVAAELALARALGKTVYTYDPEHQSGSGVRMLTPLPATAKPSTGHQMTPVAEAASGGEVRITDPETGGQKGSKLAQLGALDPASLLVLGEVAGMGTVKYERYNFLRGYAWSLSFDAMMRHALAFWSGEDVDPESGMPHMAHVAWHGLTMVAFLLHGLGTDDRPAVGIARATGEAE